MRRKGDYQELARPGRVPSIIPIKKMRLLLWAILFPFIGCRDTKGTTNAHKSVDEITLKIKGTDRFYNMVLRRDGDLEVFLDNREKERFSVPLDKADGIFSIAKLLLPSWNLYNRNVPFLYG
jgi:hypothetical protein